MRTACGAPVSPREPGLEPPPGTEHGVRPAGEHFPTAASTGRIERAGGARISTGSAGKRIRRPAAGRGDHSARTSFPDTAILRCKGMPNPHIDGRDRPPQGLARRRDLQSERPAPPTPRDAPRIGIRKGAKQPLRPFPFFRHRRHSMPRTCFSQAQAARSVSSSGRSAFHPSSRLAREGSPQMATMSPARRPTIL